MNSKQLLTLLVLGLLIGGAGLLVYKNQIANRRQGNLSLGQKLLPDLSVNDVKHIRIKRATNEVNLVYKGDLWRVSERSDYPANFQEISGFLLKAKDLKILEKEPVGESQLARLNLLPGQTTNAPVTVEIRGDAEKELATLLLGKSHMGKPRRPSPMGGMDEGFADGRYVKVGAASKDVLLISDPLQNMEPKPEQWLDKEFLKVEKVKSVAVSYPEATNSWKLTREQENGELKLADAKPGEQLDASKASGAASPLASAAFVDVATNNGPESYGLDKPVAIDIETFGGFKYNVKVGQKTNDNYPVVVSVTADFPKERVVGKDEKPEDKAKLDKEFQDQHAKLEEKLKNEQKFAGRIYFLNSWALDSVLKPRHELLAEKQEEKPADSADLAPSPATSTNSPALPQDAVPVPPVAPDTNTNTSIKTNSLPST